MKYFNRVFYLLILSVCMILLCSCRGSGDGQNVIEDVSAVDTTYKVYYVLDGKYAIEGVTWKYQSATATELVGECLDVLMQEPDDKDYLSPIAEPVSVIKYEYNENARQADVYFNKAYKTLNKEQELLRRAAIVRTLTQFDSVIDYVQFFIGDEPLGESDGRIMLMMQSDFVDSTSADLKNLTEGTLTLYFASTDGLQLAQEDVYVHYYNTSPVERVIMESLRSGPLSMNLNRTFPEDTKIYKITVTDGVCYVDLNQRFLGRIEGQNFRVKVYSIVNSLCTLETIDQVQILIDGLTSDYEEDGISLSAPLAADDTLVVRSNDAPPAVDASESETDED